ncbi:MAG: methyltransferase domain-containing protein [Prolixibacteraceae bacterium]
MKMRRHNTTGILTRSSPVRWFYKVRLKGDKVRCNVCEKNFQRFRSIGRPEINKAMCPNCYSLESTRLLWFYLSDEVLGRKNKNNVLYFEAEKAVLNRLLANGIKVEVAGLKYLNQLNSEKRQADRLMGGQFDVVLLSHVLEFTNDENSVFEELKRLLRPGGFVLLQTAINWEMDRSYQLPQTTEDQERLKKYFVPGVQRIFGSNLENQLIKAGFDVEKIDYADQLGGAAIKYYQLGSNGEIIFKCKKKNKI